MTDSKPYAYVAGPAGGAYRGKKGCRNLTCTRRDFRDMGDPEASCYGWHCILCDGPSNCQGDCRNPNCPHPPEAA